MTYFLFQFYLIMKAHSIIGRGLFKIKVNSVSLEEYTDVIQTTPKRKGKYLNAQHIEGTLLLAWCYESCLICTSTYIPFLKVENKHAHSFLFVLLSSLVSYWIVFIKILGDIYTKTSCFLVCAEEIVPRTTLPPNPPPPYQNPQIHTYSSPAVDPAEPEPTL